ncbi:MAG: peptidyl-prolyl cis-trans isomerase [Planctomycetota bacterium]|nr:peptidyl-prolyl cis-trans isomerase [Planctomycetota bacterium]
MPGFRRTTPALTSALGLLLLALAGCQGSPSSTAAPRTPASSKPGSSAHSTSTVPAPPTFRADQPLAVLDGKSISFAELGQPLLEASGGEVLSELVLDSQIRLRLEQRAVALTPALIDAERKLMALALDPDADAGQRLLKELRERRGLGERRFDMLLVRNAGMRLLVQGDVQVTDSALRQAFDYQYGPRYEARLITVANLQAAGEILDKLRGGALFADLAATSSTDSSRAQGGLLSPLSAADPTYPEAVRLSLAKLEVGQVSDPIVLEGGFAIVKLERKIAGKEAKFDDVKGSLQDGVRRQVERLQMERLARTILREADLVVLDPGLQKSWARQKRLLATQDAK